MTSVDEMYRMIMQEQAEHQARAGYSHLVAEAAHARAPRQRAVRAAVGTALIRFGTRLAPPAPAPVVGVEH